MADHQALKKSAAVIKPYAEKIVICPICEARSVQPEIKTRLFVERDREIDLKPKTYLWAIKDLEYCHPPLYYMWSCPECRFTCSGAHFSNPAKSNNILSSSFKIGAKAVSSRKYHNLLTAVMQQPSLNELPRNFEGGFALHLLALYWHEHIDEIARRETIILAKYYLRTAWLFRDLTEKFSSEKRKIDRLLSDVKKYWDQIPLSETDCLLRCACLLEAGLETSTSITTTRDEIELILLIARVWMKAGDARKAKNFGAYSRDRLAKYESELAEGDLGYKNEKSGELQKLRISQNAVLNMLADFNN